jgi:hypothetical protein
MTDLDLQRELFNYIKTAVPPHIAMVDAVADLLNISHDSVYRRIRGEKQITLDELKLLCEHFHISLDQAIQLKTDSVVFIDYEANGANTNFAQYLQGLLEQLQHISQFENKELLYLAKDITVFHFFLSEELTAFKSFFFEKSILNNPAFERKTFSLKHFDAKPYFYLGKQILDIYNSFDSVELWNYESINSTILQIEYYRDAGIFESAEDMNSVVNACDTMLEHLQKQVEKGRKFGLGETDISYKAPLKFYINELILGNNSIIAELNGNKIAFINHVVLKYISTTDKRFTQKLFDNFHNLLSRSTLISGTGERDRNKFFKVLRERVMTLKK